jgi:general secretion pathway protein G
MRIAKDKARNEAGFTLVELMVVLVIIAILMVIVFPTFVGAQTRAQKRAAESDLRTALVAAKTTYTDTGSYINAFAGVPGPPATGLYVVETSLTFNAGASNTTNLWVSVMTSPTGTTWAAARMARSGICYGIKDSTTGGTTYGENLTTCTGDWASTNSSLSAWS